MKKFLVVALSALLLLALFIPAMADTAPKFTTTSSAAKVKRGEEITLTVSIDKQINTQGLGLVYKNLTEEGAFDFVSGTWSPEILMNAELKSSNAKQAVFGFASSLDVPAGTIFTLKLKAKADAEFRNYDVVVGVSNKAPAGSTTAGVTIEVYHDCVPSANYVNTDSSKHWKTCTVDGCTKKVDEGSHVYNGTCGDTCTTCGYVRTVSHTYTKQAFDANNHWMECSGCGKVDESTKAAHAGGTATCVAKKVCSTCNQAYGEFAPCDPQEIANSTTLKTPATCKDKAVYNVTCSVCGQATGGTFQHGEPDPSKHTGGKATCKAKAVCTVCSTPYGDLDPNTHTGVNNVTHAEPATCKKEGKTEEVTCECGAVISASTPIPKKPHTINDWTVVTVATATVEGQKKGKCTQCGEEFTVFTGLAPASVAGANGIKVEPVGETTLDDGFEVMTENFSEQDIKDFEQNAKEDLAQIPATAGKDIISITVYGFSFDDTYTDAASGDAIEDDSANNSFKLPGKVKVTMPLSGDLSKYENLIIVTEGDNGDLVQMDVTVQNGTIVFETDFTINGIVLMGTAKKAPATTTDPNVPQNGDASNVGLFASLAMISILSLGVIVVSKRAKASK